MADCKVVCRSFSNCSLNAAFFSSKKAGSNWGSGGVWTDGIDSDCDAIDDDGAGGGSMDDSVLTIGTTTFFGFGTGAVGGCGVGIGTDTGSVGVFGASVLAMYRY